MKSLRAMRIQLSLVPKYPGSSRINMVYRLVVSVDIGTRTGTVITIITRLNCQGYIDNISLCLIIVQG